MKRLIIWGVLSLTPLVAHAEITVSDLIVTQREGTKIVGITYDLQFDSSEKYAEVSFSIKNGTEAVEASSISGDLGLKVGMGTGKTIIWDAEADWNKHVGDLDFYVQVKAEENPGGSTSMVSIAGGINTRTDPHFGDYMLNVASFYMSATEVTKEQWDTVYSQAIKNGYSFDNAGSGKALDHPVHTVNWYDCVKWCNARSEMEGRTPCYTVSGSVYKIGQNTPDTDFDVDGYRLPTNKEWEYAACSVVSSQRFPWGDTISNRDANYDSIGLYYSYESAKENA